MAAGIQLATDGRRAAGAQRGGGAAGGPGGQPGGLQRHRLLPGADRRIADDHAAGSFHGAVQGLGFLPPGAALHAGRGRQHDRPPRADRLHPAVLRGGREDHRRAPGDRRAGAHRDDADDPLDLVDRLPALQPGGNDPLRAFADGQHRDIDPPERRRTRADHRIPDRQHPGHRGGDPGGLLRGGQRSHLRRDRRPSGGAQRAEALPAGDAAADLARLPDLLYPAGDDVADLHAGSPIGSAAISRMPRPLESLAVWPVVTGLVFMFRSLGMAYNEVVVALLDVPRSYANLRRFAAWLAGASVAALVVMAVTPLSTFWFGTVSALSPQLVRNGAARLVARLAPAGVLRDAELVPGGDPAWQAHARRDRSGDDLPGCIGRAIPIGGGPGEMARAVHRPDGDGDQPGGADCMAVAPQPPGAGIGARPGCPALGGRAGSGGLRAIRGEGCGEQYSFREKTKRDERNYSPQNTRRTWRKHTGYQAIGV